MYPHGRGISAKKMAFTPELQSTTTGEQRPAANNRGVNPLIARGTARQGVAGQMSDVTCIFVQNFE